MTKFKIIVVIFALLISANSFSQIKKKPAAVKETPKETPKEESIPADNEGFDPAGTDTGKEEPGAFDFGLGGVFGAVTIDGKNYQQMGLRPEIRLWKLGVGLDLNILLDEDGKIREVDWNNKKAYVDKVYYVSWGKKNDPFYFKYGGLESTTLGYGTIINGYTNLLEYPTYKRQGLELSVETKNAGMEMIVSNFKEIAGNNPTLMGGGRIYFKPFSRLQIGGSIGGDLNEYKGLRDTDDDGYPDEVDMYPEDPNHVTEIDYYADKLNLPQNHATILALVNAGLISPVTRSQLTDYSSKRSMTGFWAVDAGLKLIDSDYFDVDIYSQFSKSINTGGWGYTAPGVKLTGGKLFELYGDYRQQSDDFIFGYYNDTYDLERSKYVKDSAGNLYVDTKKDKLNNAISSRGYLAGLKINFFDIVTGKGEYQDMKWGRDEKISNKSLKGELSLNKELIPMISKAKAYYVQNNVKKIQWKTESTVVGGVVGLAVAEDVTIDFKYLITYEDKNGDGKINGKDEEIRNVSVSTSSTF